MGYFPQSFADHLAGRFLFVDPFIKIRAEYGATELQYIFYIYPIIGLNGLARHTFHALSAVARIALNCFASTNDVRPHK